MQRLLLKRIRQRAPLLKNQLKRAHAENDARSEAFLRAGRKSSSHVGREAEGRPARLRDLACCWQRFSPILRQWPREVQNQLPAVTVPFSASRRRFGRTATNCATRSTLRNTNTSGWA